MKRSRTLFTAAFGLVSLFAATGISDHSWANAQRPEKEELDLAALDAAPWLVCSSLAPAPDTPRLMTWNYREMKFETKTDKNPLEANDTGSFVLIFDDHKSRAVFLGVEKDGSLERLEHKDQVGDVVSRSLPTEVTFKILGSLLLVSVSHFPAADQRFIGLLQITVAPFFSDKDPVAEMIPIACTITADDALKIQIEATRQKWLAGELAVPAPVEAPPLPPIAAHRRFRTRQSLQSRRDDLDISTKGIPALLAVRRFLSESVAADPRAFDCGLLRLSARNISLRGRDSRSRP